MIILLFFIYTKSTFTYPSLKIFVSSLLYVFFYYSISSPLSRFIPSAITCFAFFCSEFISRSLTRDTALGYQKECPISTTVEQVTVAVLLLVRAYCLLQYELEVPQT